MLHPAILRRRRMGGSAAAWTPATLFASGEEGFFFDMEAGNLFQSEGGAAAGSGDPVGYITDLSGNGRHAKQATAANRMTVGVDGDGAYYVQGDGSTDRLMTDAFVLGGAVATVVAVITVPTTPAQIFASYGTGYNAVGQWYLSNESSTLHANMGSGGVYRYERVITYSLSEKHVAIVKFDRTASDIVIDVDGSADVATTVANAGVSGTFSASYPAVIGGQWIGTVFNYPSTAKIYALLLINRALTEQEKSNLTSYLTTLKAV